MTMTTLVEIDATEINKLVDWLYGQEAAGGDIGANAKFVQAWATHRPAAGFPPRWPSFAALRTHVLNLGPACTPANVDGAITAFRAS
jgi:hypothetical protein